MTFGSGSLLVDHLSGVAAHFPAWLMLIRAAFEVFCAVILVHVFQYAFKIDGAEDPSITIPDIGFR